VVNSYLNGPGIDNHLRQTNSTSGVSYFLTDHLGSTSALTDGSGNLIEQISYDSFGNHIASSRTRYTYTGREVDSDTGLYYYRARWYDAQLGRFISEDPIRFRGGLNWFAYVDNTPLDYIDPSGLEFEPSLQFLRLTGPPTPPPLHPDNFDWWGTFWSYFDKIGQEQCFANGGFDMTGTGHGRCVYPPMIGCGVVFLESPIKPGSAGGPTAGQRFPKSVRDKTLAGDPACVFCGEPATQADHAVPRAKGGNATEENAQPACGHCNPSKGTGDFPKSPPLGYNREWPPPWWPK
jgi:RHS repeat-associated protein